MKKRILTIKRCLLPMFITIVLTIVMIPIGTVSSISITQTSSGTTLYFDPPTIDGATIGVNNTLTVNLNISNGVNVTAWQAGLIFNPSVLECINYTEGEFLSNAGPTDWTAGTIDNVAGVIGIHSASFKGDYKTSGDGRLAYLTFKVKALGVSDLHLRDVKVIDYYHLGVHVDVIDVYTVVVDATYYTVVTVSDSTGKTGTYHSGFYGHAFNQSGKEISFMVTTPKTSSYSNVSIPKDLMFVDNLDDWTVIIDGTPRNTTERTVTYNGTHYSIYFSYGEGIHKIQIISKYMNWRDLYVSLDAPPLLRFGYPALLNATVYNLGFAGNETDVELQLLINGTTVNSTVISSLQEGYNYTLNYLWIPTDEATYNVTAYAPPKIGENVTINNSVTEFVEVKRFYITVDPTSGPVGTEATVNGAWFPAQIQVSVTFNDMLLGYAMTDEDGDFTFVFNVPVSVAGVQTVKASFGEANFTSTLFTVVDVTPLDIEIDVGTMHFIGESAEFYIRTSFKGAAVNATSISALLYKPDGTTQSLTVPSPIATGFYKITYAIPADAQNGTYALVVEADYTTSTIVSHGTALKTFPLSSTLAEELALIESLKDEIAALNTTLNSLGETLADELALMEEDFESQIAALNTTLNSLNEKITQLETRIDDIKSAQEAFTIPLYATVALALIAAVGAIIIILRRKPKP